MSKIINFGAIVVFGFLMSANVNATVIICADTSDGTLSPSGKVVSSSIDYLSGSVSVSNCGPHLGNDSNDLTAALGGYGFDLSTDGGDDGGWVELDKMQELEKGSGVYTSGGIITGTNWGTTSGTFSFTDSGHSEYLIGLKFDGVYSMYLSDTYATDWVWNTDADGDGGFAISHLTVYVKGDSTECCTTKVPEPASIALMGLGLIGMGAAARRRRKS